MLCDVRIGKDSGLDLCRQITMQYPGTKVVMLTVYDDEHYLYQALRVGASGVRL
ncbi:MAG: response regulator [Mycobacterium sp.]|nr:response regulator [Mycobacterium sp.]